MGQIGQCKRTPALPALRLFNQLKACLIFSANALKGWRVMR
jgi:hypothetical protein